MVKPIFKMMLCVLVLVFSLTGITYLPAAEKKIAKVEKKEIVSASVVEPAEQPTAISRDSYELVYSFYDTQLEMVCFVSTSGIDCTRKEILSNHAKAFIEDRVGKAKEDLKKSIGKVGGATIIPRIVSLDK